MKRAYCGVLSGCSVKAPVLGLFSCVLKLNTIGCFES
mgnify:CR=1 FL=1